MAFVRLKSGQGVVVSAEQGHVIWRIMNNEIKGRKKQRDFVARILNLYLNRENAPQSYLDRHPDPREERKKQLALHVRLPYAD